MIKIKDIVVLEEAAEDMSDGREFYDAQQSQLGQYFWDCIITDIESLVVYAGVHYKAVDN